MDAVKIEGNPLPGKIQVDYDGELLVGQSILLNGNKIAIFPPYNIFYILQLPSTLRDLSSQRYKDRKFLSR